MAACIQLATNAYLEALQMPAGVPNTMIVWAKRAALTTFGDFYISETSTPNDTAGDLIAGIGSGGCFVARKFDGQTTGASLSSDTWYCFVVSSEDSSNHRVRVFQDNSPTLTKLEDITYAASVTDKRYAAIVAPDSALKIAFWAIHQGGVLTDAECRAQAVLRTSVITPGAGTFFAALSCSDHTVMDDFIGTNDFLNGGTLSTVADEPAAFTAGGGSAPTSVGAYYYRSIYF